MIRRSTLAASLLAALMLSSGCATWVTVKKVTPGEGQEGIRYALPVTVLEVKPNSAGDGTATYTLHFLPNEDQTYAIAAHSLLATHTAEFTITDGLLKKVVWNPDSTAVAAELIDTATETTTAELQRRAGKEKEEEKAAKTAADAAKQKVTGARDAVRTKERELAIAELELGQLTKAGTTGPPLEAAELTVERAKLALEFAREDLSRVMDEVARDIGGEPGSSLAGALNDPTGGKTAWGPVLYRLVDECCDAQGNGEVRLEAVRWPNGKTQLEFAAAGPPQPPAQPGPFTLDSPEVVTVSAARKLVITRTFSSAINDVQDISITGIEKTGTDLGVFSLDKGTTLKIELNVPLQEGEYFLNIDYQKKDASTDQAVVAIAVRPDDPAKPPELTSSGRERVRLDSVNDVEVQRTLSKPGPVFRSGNVKCGDAELTLEAAHVGVQVDAQTGGIALRFGPNAPTGECTVTIGLDYKDAAGTNLQGSVAIDLTLVK